MAITCSRCGKDGEAPPPHRIGFTGAAKERVLGSTCAACWKEWEGVEVKVINEYRLNFMDPEHRAMIQRSCLEWLGLPLEP